MHTFAENSYQGQLGLNSWGKKEYGGPCPPSGIHRYFFKLYAIDKNLEFQNIPNKTDILKAIEKNIIASSELIGLYSRNKE